ncbi:MAG: phosphoethanolamine--lipid A transferase [Oxalobacter sp.]|nr:MAG: phosphoethanolamine--lipid A transferase [Oxalobacter sp.]
MIFLQRNRLATLKLTANPVIFTLAASIFLALAYNATFWNRFFEVTGGVSYKNIPFYVATFLIMVLVFNAFFTAIAFRPLIKPVLTLIFCTTAFAAYFMHRYGVRIDAAMMQNVIETNAREVADLLNWRMAMFFLTLGVVPSIIVWRTKLTFPDVRRNLLIKCSVIGLSLIAAIGLTVAFYKHFAPTFRQHRDLQFMLTPINYLWATNSYLKRKLGRPKVVAPLGTDAVKGALWHEKTRKTVTVIVLGETARAMNFSLNGYARNTNPELSKQAGLVNFTNVQSCGTATAESVPCMFSSLGRNNYSDSKAKSQQGLMDVLSHAGFDVLWRNNNSGCKGVCDRVEHEDMSKPVAGNALCTDEECYDEHLLDGLPERIRSSKKDMVIVLHQKGSHGPTYWKRYPEKFRQFGPECATSDLQECSSEAIAATYDNTILYTDHFVSQTINMLRRMEKNEGIDASLIYISDHGESLGENGMYLHGAPYRFSPIEQRHVPFMVWMSDSFRSQFAIDATCLAARSSQMLSHDNLFHSVLGMLNIKTSVRNPALDLFHACT